ncbi:MAG: 6-carboxytetrahydropterin synthase QueD [Candidatus Omnitrophica bacterium 4484_70.2]|nr:MAG: 6-carboxytetrahydropterin synthase QueD [Candidatus Omnitrophica bacterium 4484_70.2]
MYSVKVQDTFCGAHFLRNYKGKCEKLHGHNWKVEVEVFSQQLNNEEMVMDFSLLKKILQGILLRYDHSVLNELEEFKVLNPTSENIASLILQKIEEKIKRYKNILKIKVSVWEQEDSCASIEKSIR